jgi:RNA recognition motif-containing protein
LLTQIFLEDDTGRSRGFGFVEFTQDISADRFEQAFPHIIYDRHLNVSRCGKIRQVLFCIALSSTSFLALI